MNKNLLVSAGVALLVVVLGLSFFGPTKEIVREVTKERLGAFPGPSITEERLEVGGVGKFYKSGTCNDATSTLFAIQNPFRATSSWSYASVEVTKAATSSATIFGAYGITVGTSTSQGPASSTVGLIQSAPFANATVGTVFSGSVSATSSKITTSGDNPYYAGTGTSSGTTTHRVVIGPDEYIVGYATGTLQAISDQNSDFACRFGLEFVR